METESDTPLEGGWCAPPPASLPFHRISESSHHHHQHPGSTWKSRILAANSVSIAQNPLQPLFCETRPGSFKAMGGWLPNLARMQIDVGPISELAQTVLCWNTIGRKFFVRLGVASYVRFLLFGTLLMTVKKLRKTIKLSEIEDLRIKHSARCQIATDKNLLPQTSQHFC